MVNVKMTTESEKLKKRLELMNQELAKQQRKLKRHSKKKLLQMKDGSQVQENEAHYCNTERFQYSESVCTEQTNTTSICNVGVTGECSEYEHFSNVTATKTDAPLEEKLGETLLSNDCSQDTYFLKDTKTNTENLVDIMCLDEYVDHELSPPKVSCEILHDHAVQEEWSFPLGQAQTKTPSKHSKCDLTPGDISPVLTQKSGILKSSKPSVRYLPQRKMKGLISSYQSRRNNYMRELPFIRCPELSQTDDFSSKDKSSELDDTVEKETVIVHCSLPPTIPVVNNTQIEIENLMNIKSLEFETCTIQLSEEKGALLTAFCGKYYFILVQEMQLNIWRFSGVRESKWFHAGSLTRENIPDGKSLGWAGNNVTVGSENMFICVEFWTRNSSMQSSSLSMVVYYYEEITTKFQSYCLQLRQLNGHIRNLKVCIHPELSVIVSWMNDSSSTSIVKFSLDNDSQSILKTTELSPVKEVLNSVHFIEGCWAVILGENASNICIWEHCTGALIKIIPCPRHDTKLQYFDEDQGFLFVSICTHTHIKLLVVNLTNGKWKMLRQMEVPQAYKLTGLRMDRSTRLVAISLEGIICLDLKTGQHVAEKQSQHKNLSSFLGEQFSLYVSMDFKVEIICTSSLKTI